MAGQATEKSSSAKARRLVEMTAAYRPFEGSPDEFIGADDRPRGHWLEFFDKMAGLGTADIARRFEAVERSIREQAVSYRAYGETTERIWPLSHMPLLISETGLGGHRGGRHPARRNFRLPARRPLRQGRSGQERVFARRRRHRQFRFPASDDRRKAARRPLAQPLRRRPRARTRRAMVGAVRPRAGPLRPGLCAGKPPESDARLPGHLPRHERAPPRPVLQCLPGRTRRARLALRPAHLPLHARPLQRDLLRTGLSGPLPGFRAGGGRRSGRARRPRPCPHHRRPETRRCDLAAHRRRFRRPAGAERRLAARRARPGRDDSPGQCRCRQRARLGRGGDPHPARLHSGAGRPSARRKAVAAQYRHLVVRAGARARACAVAPSGHGDIPRLRRGADPLVPRRLRGRRRTDAWDSANGWPPRSGRAAPITSARRWRACRPRPPGSARNSNRAPSCCAYSPRSTPTASSTSCPAVSAAFPTGSTSAPSPWARACRPPTCGSSPTSRWNRPPCCRRPNMSRSAASWAICRAAPPTTCSGSDAISNAPRRRCG